MRFVAIIAGVAGVGFVVEKVLVDLCFRNFPPAAYTAPASQRCAERNLVMTEITVENLFNQIVQLSPPEQSRLWVMLDNALNPQSVVAHNRTPAVVVTSSRLSVAAENSSSSEKKLEPIPRPDRSREMQWLHDHAREYIGQWVALDGARLIAHGFDAKAVYAAARADGAYLPMVDSIEDPDRMCV